MTPQRRVIEAIKASDIKCIALVDDAFDPPSIDGDDMGAVLDLIGGINIQDFADIGIALSLEEVDAAKRALEESEYENDGIILFIEKLFRAFIETGDAKFDPKGQFSRIKSPNLAYVKPIIQLLASCENLKVVKCGSHASEYDCAIKEAQLIFMDFFLKAGLTADGNPNAAEQEDARQASLGRLRDLISEFGGEGDVPSVIMMSSHDVEDRIVKFHEDLLSEHSKVYLSRFGFIQKKQFEGDATGGIAVKSPAIDALLHIIQTSSFSRAMHQALALWRDGAKKAVDATWNSISRLEVKDFAYLLRLRLQAEGVPMSHYIDWLFRESLSSAVSRNVDWQHVAFAQINDIDGPAKRIFGAFDGPTEQIAKLFDDVRIEKPHFPPRVNYKAGDLYRSKRSRDKIYCVVTPECDLVMRKGKMKAPRLLMVGGRLQGINEQKTSLWDFILIDGVSYSIAWDLKDVRTVETTSWAKPDAPGRHYEHLGTLKPIYAEELRSRVISDLSRVAVNVAPTLSQHRNVVAVVAGKTKDLSVDLTEDKRAACSLIFPRSSHDKPAVIFFESAVSSLIKRLSELNLEDLSEDAASKIRKLKDNEGQKRELFDKLCRSGLSMDETSMVFGMSASSKAIGHGGKGRPWCQLVVGAGLPVNG